jgi:hypothetical protein
LEATDNTTLGKKDAHDDKDNDMDVDVDKAAPQGEMSLEDFCAQGLYAVLGVETGVSSAALRKAYSDKCQTMHPERGGCPHRYRMLRFAFDILSNKKSRGKYDTDGKQAFSKTWPRVPQASTAETPEALPAYQVLFYEAKALS